MKNCARLAEQRRAKPSNTSIGVPPGFCPS
jgi:hypothetical protein